MAPEGSTPSASVEHCAECGKLLDPLDRVAAGDRVFCTSCHAMLRQQIEGAVQAMGEDINYANAALGALLGGVVGILGWWGVTVATGWPRTVAALKMRAPSRWTGKPAACAWSQTSSKMSCG